MGTAVHSRSAPPGWDPSGPCPRQGPPRLDLEVSGPRVDLRHRLRDDVACRRNLGWYRPRLRRSNGPGFRLRALSRPARRALRCSGARARRGRLTGRERPGDKTARRAESGASPVAPKSRSSAGGYCSRASKAVRWKMRRPKSDPGSRGGGRASPRGVGVSHRTWCHLPLLPHSCRAETRPRRRTPRTRSAPRAGPVETLGAPRSRMAPRRRGKGTSHA